MVLGFLTAVLCGRRTVPKYDEECSANPEETLLNGHFGGCGFNHCAMSCCCPVVQWSSNMHMAGLVSFWYAFWILGVCFLPAIVFGALGLFLAVPLVYYRQQLRARLG